MFSYVRMSVFSAAKLDSRGYSPTTKDRGLLPRSKGSRRASCYVASALTIEMMMKNTARPIVNWNNVRSTPRRLW